MPHQPEESEPEAPDWRDAGLPRYQGGTHRRVEAPPEGQVGVVLRALSVMPFVLFALLAFLSAVSLLVIVLLGSGKQMSLSSWVHGRSAGQIALGLLELVGIEVLCVGLLILCWLAAREGAKERPRPWIWPLGLVLGVVATGLLLGTHFLAPRVFTDASLGGNDWLAPLVLFVYLIVAAVLRLRRQ